MSGILVHGDRTDARPIKNKEEEEEAATEQKSIHVPSIITVTM